jgi:phage recombination protein Bet
MTENLPTLFSSERLELIKSTLFPAELTNDQFMLFIEICKHLNLDPIAGQIHALPYRRNPNEPPTLISHVSIQGYRTMAARTGQFQGTCDATLLVRIKDGSAIEVPHRLFDPENHKIISGTIGVRYTHLPSPEYATAVFESYAKRKRDGSLFSNWQSMADIMILKCAEGLAHRKAAPAVFAGVYVTEELDQITNSEKTVPPPPKASPRKNVPKKEHESALELWETISEFLRAKDMTGNQHLLIETALDLALSRLEVSALEELPTERIPELAEFARTTLLHLLRDKGMIK